MGTVATPSILIIDSQNLRGQAKDNLGAPRYPSMAGLDAAFSRLGLEVAEAYVSASMPRPSDAKRLARQAERTERYVSVLKKDTRVTFLEGELHTYGSRPQEKLVDVLCAVETVRQAKRIADGTSDAGAVVVISQDIDVTPGVDLALEFGVPVFVAAAGSIHRRSQPFILLDELALFDIVAARPNSGSMLRRAIATAAAYPEPSDWEFLYETRNREGQSIGVLQHSDGYKGAIDSAAIDGVAVGERVALAPIGVVHDLPNQFPQLQLGSTADRGGDLHDGRVLFASDPLSSIVRLSDRRKVKVFRGACGLAPGTDVLVQDRGGNGFAFVGPLSDTRLLTCDGHPDLAPCTVLATVTAHDGDDAFASSADGTDVRIRTGARRTTVGSTYLVGLVSSSRNNESMFGGMVVSTPLPT